MQSSSEGERLRALREAQVDDLRAEAADMRLRADALDARATLIEKAWNLREEDSYGLA